jgi:hypothetical protein
MNGGGRVAELDDRAANDTGGDDLLQRLRRPAEGDRAPQAVKSRDSEVGGQTIPDAVTQVDRQPRVDSWTLSAIVCTAAQLDIDPPNDEPVTSWLEFVTNILHLAAPFSEGATADASRSTLPIRNASASPSRSPV